MSSAAGKRRLTQRVEYEVPVRGPRIASPELARRLMLVTFGAGIVAAVVCATALINVPVPTWTLRPAAAVLLFVLTIALTNRVGGHMRIWGLVAGVLGLLAATVQTGALLASAAGMTAVVGAVLAVMMTRPSRQLLGVLREAALAIALALVAMCGVAAWNIDVVGQRFILLVLAASVGLVMACVWSLGAGLHGLGRLHVAVLAGGALALVAVLAYAALVRSYGSPVVVDTFSDAIIWTRRTIGGTPRPGPLLIGFPALVAGIALRARRREGWWVQVFAVIATVQITAGLVSPGARPSYVGLSILYTAIPGLLIGLVVRHFLLAERGSRAARAIEELVRDEPGRLHGLK